MFAWPLRATSEVVVVHWEHGPSASRKNGQLLDVPSDHVQSAAKSVVVWWVPASDAPESQHCREWPDKGRRPSPPDYLNHRAKP